MQRQEGARLDAAARGGPGSYVASASTEFLALREWCSVGQELIATIQPATELQQEYCTHHGCLPCLYLATS
jgi:hypothetical protein